MVSSGPCAAIVSFEGSNALWRYRLVDGLPEGAPTEVDQSTEWRRALPHNGGVEGMAGGWMVSEQLREPDGRAIGRLTEGPTQYNGCSHEPCPGPSLSPGPSREVTMSLPVSDDFSPTDADRPDVSSGAPIIVLQRRYSPEAGNAARAVRSMDRIP